MKTLFIIGGIGSGKSTVTRLFADKGASTLDLDRVGHQVLELEEVKRELVERFGPDVLDSEGNVIRVALAKHAFATPEATEALNAISAPRITEALKRWVSEQHSASQPVVLVEVSAYDGTRSHYSEIADGIIAVVAPETLRVERAVAKGFTEDDVIQRMKRQPTDEKRTAWADFIIENDGTLEELCAQVDSVWNSLNA